MPLDPELVATPRTFASWYSGAPSTVPIGWAEDSSDAASFVTGHLLAVDGGFLASGVNQ